MKTPVLLGLLAGVALVPCLAHASTVTTTTLNFARNNVGLDGGSALSFNRFTTVDVGIADLRFGAEASGGDVDARADITFNSTFDRTVDLADANAVQMNMSLVGLSFSYEAFTGAEAGAFVDFDSFVGINPPEFRVIGDDYRLDTADSRSGFGSTGDDRDTTAIVGVGPDLNIGLAVRAQVTLNASQTTSLEVNDLRGLLVATHETGARVERAITMTNGIDLDLDLSLAGEWRVALENIRLRNRFDSSTGISPGYELGLAFLDIGGGCGDYGTDDDNDDIPFNGKSCGGDTGVSGTSGQLTLIDPDPFEIAWGRRSANLGSVQVMAPPPPVPPAVPLPAGAFFLIGGLMGFAGLRLRGGARAAR